MMRQHQWHTTCICILAMVAGGCAPNHDRLNQAFAAELNRHRMYDESQSKAVWPSFRPIQTEAEIKAIKVAMPVIQERLSCRLENDVRAVVWPRIEDIVIGLESDTGDCPRPTYARVSRSDHATVVLISPDE